MARSSTHRRPRSTSGGKDIEAALSNRLRTSLGTVAGPVFAPLLTPAFELLLPPILGVRPDELRPIGHIGAATAPLLIASGTADDRTPISEARFLFEHAPKPKQFWAVQGAAQVDLERYDPDAYRRGRVARIPTSIFNDLGHTENAFRPQIAADCIGIGDFTR